MSKKKNVTEPPVKRSFEDQVELYAMGLQACSCVLDRPKYVRLRKRGGDDEVRLISADVKVDDHGESYFDGSVAYQLLVRDKRNEVDPLRLECTFGAHFHGPKTISRNEAQRFLETYFKVVSWPYFRQFVSDMTSRMAIGTLVLPLLPEGKDD